jgi:hypothetical protein
MPDLYSTQRVRRVGRFDGWTRIARVRRVSDWERVHGWVRLTPDNLRRLKQEDVREVEVRRWGRRARMPMTWLHHHFH